MLSFATYHMYYIFVHAVINDYIKATHWRVRIFWIYVSPG
jgi:hypothetical protein